MKLDKIDITNFRCFEKLTIPFEDDVTLFVGVNGTGKTSVLDAIAFALFDILVANGVDATQESRQENGVVLLDNDSRVFTYEPTPHEDMSGRIADGKGVGGGSGSGAGFGDASGFGGGSGDGAGHGDGTSGLRLWQPPPTASAPNIQATVKDYFHTEHMRDSPIRWSATYHPPAEDFLSGGLPSKHIHSHFRLLWDEIRRTPGAHIPLPAVAYYRSSRRVSGTVQYGDVFKQVYQQADAYKKSLDATAGFNDTCVWLYVVEGYAMRNNVPMNPWGVRLFETIRLAMRTVIEEARSFDFDRLPPELVVEIDDKAGRRKLALSQLSDGYRNTIAIIIDFARRLAVANPTSTNPLAEAGILMIDEIELHLHPAWQQTIIPRLRKIFPNTQIIASTHSPQVVSTVHKHQLRILSQDFAIVSLPEDVGTYGVESSHALAHVFGVHARPEAEIPSVKELHRYLKMVEGDLQETDDGKTLRASLDRDLGRSDASLVLADMRIAQRKILRSKK